ncbi:MAG: phosphoesterase [Rickettsiales bacterium]|nr:MAG: phosphoesterase [Rickettsiales bacterium]
MYEIFYSLFGYNKQLFLTINHYTNIGALPQVLQAISSVFFIANFAIGYIAACVYVYYKSKKAPNQEAYFTPIYNELVRLGACYAMFGFVFAGLKFSVNLQRPFCSLPPADFITIADTSLERCLSSFPSAHTGLAILVAYCFWRHMNPALKILACLVAMAVATSRVTLAMHYPADIIYSIIATLISILIGNNIYALLKNLVVRPIGKMIARLLFN